MATPAKRALDFDDKKDSSEAVKKVSVSSDVIKEIDVTPNEEKIVDTRSSGDALDVVDRTPDVESSPESDEKQESDATLEPVVVNGVGADPPKPESETEKSELNLSVDANGCGETTKSDQLIENRTESPDLNEPISAVGGTDTDCPPVDAEKQPLDQRSEANVEKDVKPSSDPSSDSKSSNDASTDTRSPDDASTAGPATKSSNDTSTTSASKAAPTEPKSYKEKVVNGSQSPKTASPKTSKASSAASTTAPTTATFKPPASNYPVNAPGKNLKPATR